MWFLSYMISAEPINELKASFYFNVFFSLGREGGTFLIFILSHIVYMYMYFSLPCDRR